MPVTISTEQYLDTAAELLAGGADIVAVPIKGSSMRPFLKEGDTVFVSPLSSPPGKGQIILYRRPGGRYILHRVLSKKGGAYSTLGDAQLIPEHGILPSQIIGCAAAADRCGRRITPSNPVWKFYTAAKFLLYPFQRALYMLHRRKKGSVSIVGVEQNQET